MRWKCIQIGPSSESWTLKKVYKTDDEGYLIDDLGKTRLKPKSYNECSRPFWTRFAPYKAEKLENK